MEKYRIYLFILFLLVTVFAIFSIYFNSVTVDEYTHVPVGLSQLRTGKFNMEMMNPPLVRMWASLPLLFYRPRLHLEPGFENIDYVFYARQFMLENAEQYHTLVVLCRIMIFLLIIPLAILLWKWTSKEYGAETGVVALFLLLLNPNILAHATLATTDFGLTVIFFGAIYALKRFIETPNWKYAIILGIVLGIAQSAKFTSVLLYPIFLIGIILVWNRNLFINHKIGQGNALPLPRRLMIMIVVILLISILVINLIYCFQLTGTPMRYFEFRSSLFQTIKNMVPASLPIPLPFFYITGIDAQLAESKGYDNYLFGTLSNQGWWYYYLFAFIIKNPIPFLLCLIIGCYLYLRNRKFNQIDWMLILPPVLILLLFSISSTKNIGLRFILPAFPFLVILAAQIIKSQFPKKKIGFSLLAIWYIISCGFIAPNYLAYFNEFIGGPAQGYRYLLDSNLDWGQDLIRLRHYLEKKHINQIALSHFGPVDPAIYGINAVPLTSEPRTGLVAISVNNLYGISLVHKQEFAWLKQFQPIARVGYSIFIYDIATTQPH
ncbi:MAG: glycosyltransferase family 39 protein [bacterium]|nr:glycosyltransferase family 39 protein [bacterium]